VWVKAISGTCSSGMPTKKQHVSQSLPRLGGGAVPISPGSSWPEALSGVNYFFRNPY